MGDVCDAAYRGGGEEILRLERDGRNRPDPTPTLLPRRSQHETARGGGALNVSFSLVTAT